MKIVTFIILAVAAFFDYKYKKVPNGLILSGYLIGVANAIFEKGVVGIIYFVGNALWPILILIPLFFIKALGAGDIKLFSVISGLLDARVVVYLIAFSFLTGALIAIIRLLALKEIQLRYLRLQVYLKECLIKRQVLPYQTIDEPESYLTFAVCIFVAYVFQLVTGVCI